jgi:hypothetical protein
MVRRKVKRCRLEMETSGTLSNGAGRTSVRLLYESTTVLLLDLISLPRRSQLLSMGARPDV